MPLLPDLGSLRAELRAAGVFEHREARSWLELAGLVAGIAAGLAGVAWAPWWAIGPLVVAAGVLCTTTAMLGHEGSHKSFSASPARNALLTHLVFPLFAGLSARYWREKHDRLHHGHPNVDGQDPDIRPFPFVSSREEHARCGPLRRWFHRHCQPWAFWPLSAFIGVGMRVASLRFLAAELRRRGPSRGWLLDAGCVTAHYAGWLLLPSLVWGPLVAFGLYAGVFGVVGVLLAMIFAPAHIGLPVVHDQHHDWLHQLETTRNLALPRGLSWFVVGLDHQIEHHLFPRIPHAHLARAATITARWCQRHQLPYQRVAYGAAFRDASRFMASAWRRPTSSAAQLRHLSLAPAHPAAGPGTGAARRRTPAAAPRPGR